MTLYTMLPTGIGYSDLWTLGAGSSKWAACAVNDDGTTYIHVVGGSVVIQSFTMGPAPAISSVTTVKTGGRGAITSNPSSPSSEQMNTGVRLSGTNSLNLALSTTAASMAYTDFSLSTISRPGGGSWVPADLNSVQQLVAFPYTDGTSNASVTYMFLQIDGVPLAGVFAFLIGSLAGAALGLAEMSGLARAVYRKTGTLIKPDEYMQAWRDLREYRHPVFFWAR